MKKQMKPYLSVVIPMYNEEKNLKKGVLFEVEDFLKRQSYSSEVIISDDESTDNSLVLAEEFVKSHSRFKLLKNKHGGKPFAIRSGVMTAGGEICLFVDMDQSTPIKEVEKLLGFYEKGFSVVIGSRGAKREGFATAHEEGFQGGDRPRERKSGRKNRSTRKKLPPVRPPRSTGRW